MPSHRVDSHSRAAAGVTPTLVALLPTRFCLEYGGLVILESWTLLAPQTVNIHFPPYPETEVITAINVGVFHFGTVTIYSLL